MTQRNLTQTIDVDALLHALDRKVQAEQLTETTWRVSSYSQPGRWWTLHADSLGVDCTCPAGQHDRSCHHAALVVALRAGELRVRHSGGVGHVGPCGERCGALPIRRVQISTVCVVDPDPHHGCIARLRLLPAAQP